MRAVVMHRLYSHAWSVMSAALATLETPYFVMPPVRIEGERRAVSPKHINRSRDYSNKGKRHLRQIAAGQLREQNGLVVS